MEKEILYTINSSFQNIIIIKKSEFIASLSPIESLSDANKILDDVRKKYYDATHNCYAYIFNDNGQINMKFSDDGEPGGTAGIVILDVLKKRHLMNVLCIVTRYFGGIKLGAGGLVRAYSESASEVINNSKLNKIIKKDELCFKINYQSVNECLTLLNDYEQISKDFKDSVTLKYLIPTDEISQIQAKLIEITKNNIQFL